MTAISLNRCWFGQEERTALMVTARDANEDGVQQLLRAGASPNTRDKVIFSEVCGLGTMHIVIKER